MLKRFLILIITTLFVVPTVMGQAGTGGKSKDEMSIEESYLLEYMEMSTIRETTRSNDESQKNIALELIANSLERGSTNEELRTSLEFLSLESTQNQVRQGRRLSNDFPLVRRQAAKLLGTVGTKEAKAALIKICTVDKEPMVLQEAVKSLATIGMNDNDDAVNTIVWTVEKFHNNSAPNDILAIAAIDAIEKFAQKDKRITPGAVQLLMKINTGPYMGVVKERAKHALEKVGGYAAQSAQQQQTKK